MDFKPEGIVCETQENQTALSSLANVREAMAAGTILEARAMVCDGEHNLIVDLGAIRGVIPREECALGIREGTVRDIAIISRVNKPVCFVVTGLEEDGYGGMIAKLSRLRAQELCKARYLDTLRPGDILPAKITHLEQFGAFVDIGCGVVSLIPIDAISVSRISHPRDRFTVGQDILAIVKTIDNGRITLSHRELLGTWEENTALFAPGETVGGIVRSVEEYGVFVELTPNLAGLAEKREGVKAGQQASVYIKSMLPDKMKVKLILIDTFTGDLPPPKLHYYVSGGRLRHWVYSTEQSNKRIETVFDPT